VSFERLAGMMIELQEQGCHSIGFVSPTHFVPQIMKSLEIAIGQGLRIRSKYSGCWTESSISTFRT
jgi:putative pyruvate formate lyase activating enzyme